MAIQPPLFAGMDIGGTKMELYIVDGDGDLVLHKRSATPAHPDRELVQGVVQMLGAALQELNCTHPLTALGIGIPGQIENGVVRLAVNLNLVDFPLVSELEKVLGIPCKVENDVRAAVLGARHYFEGCLESVKNIVYLSIGTGIAAGMLVDGRLYRGISGMAGEVGHIPVASDGPICVCGNRGCLEAVASGPAIAHFAQSLAQSYPDSALHSIYPLTTEGVFEAARQGDSAAVKVIQTVGRYLSLAIYSLVMNYDPEKVAVGGGVSHAGAVFWQPVETALDEIRASSTLAQRMLFPERVILLPATYKAGAWGAVELAQGIDGK